MRCANVITVAVSLILSLWFHGSGITGGRASEPIVIELAVDWQGQKKHTKPLFDITVTNVSGKPARALDVRGRRDFVDSYLNVEIIPLSLNFEILRGISDPNVINEEDFVDLAPGQSIEFKSIVLPINYQALTPGLYRAYAVYRIDPYKRPKEKYKSNEIVFEIEY